MNKRSCLMLAGLVLSVAALAQDSLSVTEIQPDTAAADSVWIAAAIPTADTALITPGAGPLTTTRTVTSNRFYSLPDAHINSVISATNGVVNGNGSLYFRGSRSDEIAYFIDGFSVKETHTGEMAAPINLAAVEELSITTGGWGVEYGNSLGGLINFKTREYQGKPGIFGKWTIEPVRNNHRIEASVVGALPFSRGITYLLSAETDNGDDIRPCFMPETYYVHAPSKDYFWADTLQYSWSVWDTTDTMGLDNWSGDWADSSEKAWQNEKERRIAGGWVRGWTKGGAEYLPHSDYNKYRAVGKLSYSLGPIGAKLKLLGIVTRDQQAEYSAFYKYNLDGYYSRLQKSFLLGATWEHGFSDRFAYSVRASRHHSQTRLGIRDTVSEKGRSWWQDYTFLPDSDTNGNRIFDAYEGLPPFSNINNPYGVSGIFCTYGLAPRWERTSSDYNSVKVDASYKINRPHRLSGGVEMKQYRVNKKYTFFASDPWNSAWNPEVFFYEHYDYKPIARSAYVSDDFTNERFLIQGGIRVDHINLGDDFNYHDTYNYYINAYVKEAASIQVALKAALLLTERTNISLGYGQHRNTPLWQNIYYTAAGYWPRHTKADSAVDFQKANLYEAGVHHQLGQGTSLDVNFYRKNMHHLLQPGIKTDPYIGFSYLEYAYAQYGTARGMEVYLKHATDYFLGEFNYSYSRALSADQDSNHIVLSYNQPHKGNITTIFYSGQDFGPQIARRHPLGDITVGLTNTFGTGFPFTRTDLLGHFIGGINDSLLPSYLYTDLLISKKVKYRRVALSLDVEVLNLFNRKIVQGVYPATGEVAYDGKVISISDFSVTPIPDSVSYTVDGNGDPVMTPNPYYSRWRDLNGDGQIDQNEKYITYKAAWNDYASDPFNARRVPYSRDYMVPRRFKLALSVSF